jgi:hypothetical protein
MKQSATGERSEPVAFRNKGAVSYNSSLSRARLGRQFAVVAVVPAKRVMELAIRISIRRLPRSTGKFVEDGKVLRREGAPSPTLLPVFAGLGLQAVSQPADIANCQEKLRVAITCQFAQPSLLAAECTNAGGD